MRGAEDLASNIFTSFNCWATGKCAGIVLPHVTNFVKPGNRIVDDQSFHRDGLLSHVLRKELPRRVVWIEFAPGDCSYQLGHLSMLDSRHQSGPELLTE